MEIGFPLARVAGPVERPHPVFRLWGGTPPHFFLQDMQILFARVLFLWKFLQACYMLGVIKL